ncbi:hypothetical protein BX600DRAFT_519551 [Xylariales sp. PMI_506]|nr:hypothetical protein BX600DRAFT_519551 [Xylariales sp. PMI_506]
MSSTELGHSRHGIPDAVMQQIDKYVDSLAPQIQPRIVAELDIFQQKTIDSLEEHIVEALSSLFNKGRNSPRASIRGQILDDSPPDVYGGQSLPFADEISRLTRSFVQNLEGADDDIREIFDLTETTPVVGSITLSRGGVDSSNSFPQGRARAFFATAMNAVQDHLDNESVMKDNKLELDGLLGVLSRTIKETARNPEEKARFISPDIKDKVGAKLREQHAFVAERFTGIALNHIKRWLRGNTTTREVGDGIKEEFGDQVKGLAKGIGGLLSGHKMYRSGDGNPRGFVDGRKGDKDEGNYPGGGSGLSKVISDKLSTGLASVHREVRLEFRRVLGDIEKQLFQLLPHEFKQPLEKVLGGNPFDPELDRNAKPQSDHLRNDFTDNIRLKVIGKLRHLIQKVQESLRVSILGVVNGGHRKFERQSWMLVQMMVELKVQKYLPHVKITIPDDIGNEGKVWEIPQLNLEQSATRHRPFLSRLIIT